MSLRNFLTNAAKVAGGTGAFAAVFGMVYTSNKAEAEKEKQKQGTIDNHARAMDNLAETMKTAAGLKEFKEKRDIFNKAQELANQTPTTSTQVRSATKAVAESPLIAKA